MTAIDSNFRDSSIIGDFGSIADEYHKYTSQAPTKWFGLLKLAEMLNVTGARRILDYGCGTGDFDFFLRSRGKSVLGVDISDRMIKEAQRLYPPAECYVHISDSSELQRLTGFPFEAAIATWVDCVMEERAMIECMVRDIFLILQPGAPFFLMNSNWEEGNGTDFTSIRLNRLDNLQSGCPVKITIKSTPPIDIPNWYWSSDDLVSILQVAGFEDVSVAKPIASLGDSTLGIEQQISPIRILHGRKPH